MDTSFTQNRELSWLKFNERVLEEANDKDVKLFERLKFYSIFDSNLEEFFMVRVGTLTDLSDLKKEAVDNKSGLSPSEQLKKIMEVCKDLYVKKDLTYERIVNDLKNEDIFLEKVSQLGPKERDFLEYYFDNNIEPILNFQVVDGTRPFPRLPNLSLNVVFSLKSKKFEVKKESRKESKKEKFYLGLIFLPDKINRYIKISDKTIVLIEDVIKEFGDKVFENYICEEKYIMSITRNADISHNDDDYDVDKDFRSHMKTMLKKRKRLKPVRLEVDGELTPKLKEILMEKLHLEEDNIFVTKSPIIAGFIFNLVEEMPEDLKEKFMDEKFSPQASYMIDPRRKVIDQVQEKDMLLSYPYESMDPIIDLLNEAAEDEAVISIKITLYRIAKDSKIAAALIKAAENGKEVFVLMELRARFDEDNNILWSSRLEEAGCKIVYGFENYKCHSKVLLITRIEGGKASFITQVATGNYNEKTAKLYTDFSYLTSNIEIGMDAKDLFDNIMIGNLDGEKMSKSLGNFFTVREIAEKYDLGLVRFFLLSTHYRNPVNFSDTILDQAKAGLERLTNARDNAEFMMSKLEDTKMSPEETGLVDELNSYKTKFIEAMDDDLNTSDAISAIFELAKFMNTNIKDTSSKEFIGLNIDLFNELTGVLNIANKSVEENDDLARTVEEMIAKRAEAKKNKDFALADKIREELLEMGIVIEDTRQGVKWKRK